MASKQLMAALVLRCLDDPKMILLLAARCSREWTDLGCWTDLTCPDQDSDPNRWSLTRCVLEQTGCHRSMANRMSLPIVCSVLDRTDEWCSNIATIECYFCPQLKGPVGHWSSPKISHRTVIWWGRGWKHNVFVQKRGFCWPLVTPSWS